MHAAAEIINTKMIRNEYRNLLFLYSKALVNAGGGFSVKAGPARGNEDIR